MPTTLAHIASRAPPAASASAATALAIAALSALLGWIAYRGMIWYRIRDPALIAESNLASGRMDESFLGLPWIVGEVLSPRGYPLRVRALGGSSHRVALFHHGIGWNWTSLARQMELFRSRGWTVVAFDSRGHGDSGGGRPSYGVFESRDMKAVADWALDRFPRAGGFIAVGESMGAATALMYAAIDPRLDAVIADCPYSSALGEMRHRLKRALVPPGLRALAVAAADAICRARQGFSLAEADPARSILETEVPVMLVHGLDDDYVPWRMSVVMAETRRRALPDSLTELLLVPGARHGGSLGADPEGYERALLGFVDESLARAGRLGHNVG
jgi:pimeloyl-ACP methyl ester carboxylesterase